MKRILILMIVGILSISLVSAGLFDWLFGNNEEPYEPAFNISNDFNNKQNQLKTLPICGKSPDNAQCRDKNPNYQPLDVSSFNYFYEKTGGILRFKNE